MSRHEKPAAAGPVGLKSRRQVGAARESGSWRRCRDGCRERKKPTAASREVDDARQPAEVTSSSSVRSRFVLRLPVRQPHLRHPARLADRAPRVALRGRGLGVRRSRADVAEVGAGILGLGNGALPRTLVTREVSEPAVGKNVGAWVQLYADSGPSAPLETAQPKKLPTGITL